MLVDIFCYGLTFDYLRMKILRENPKDLESAIQVAMSEQNLRPGLAIRGSSITHTTQNDDNRQSISRFDTITSLLNERLVNFSPTETRQEEPMEINHTRNRVCFKCKGKCKSVWVIGPDSVHFRRCCIVVLKKEKLH